MNLKDNTLATNTNVDVTKKAKLALVWRRLINHALELILQTFIGLSSSASSYCCRIGRFP